MSELHEPAHAVTDHKSMESKTERLNALFARWQQQLPGREFTKDGIVDEAAWLEAPPGRRVLFLLKEDNKRRPAHEDDLRTILRDRPWPMLDAMAYGLQRLAPGHPLPPWMEAYAMRGTGRGLRAAAIMNLKKEPGGGVADGNLIRDWARANLEPLREQLAIIEPDIVVCGGTIGYVFEVGLVPLGEPVDPDGGCYRYGSQLWVIYHHPSVRSVFGSVLYYGLMATVDQALRSNNSRLPTASE